MLAHQLMCAFPDILPFTECISLVTDCFCGLENMHLYSEGTHSYFLPPVTLWIPQSGCSRLNPRSLWREQRMWFLLPNLFLGFLHFQVPNISVAFSWLSLSIAACLWWLILCINLSGSQGVHIFWLNIFFWLCLYRCFWMGFEAIDWVKQIALPNVGGFHPIYWGP